MPEIVACPAPVSQQVEVVEFFAEKSVRLGGVVATHPDAGGKAEEFVRIRKCYEEALAIASKTDQSP